MRTRNRPLLLRRALQSVHNQHFQDWQLVVVNDAGDADEVHGLVDAFPEIFRRKTQVIDVPESKGMEAASNAGLDRLDSDYVLIHDDDDSLHPEFCAKTIAYLDAPPHPRVRGVITGTERIIERIKGNEIKLLKRRSFHKNIRTVRLQRMLAGNFFAPIAFVFSRVVCEELGRFREDLPVLGDWEFNVRFLQKYEIGVIADVLAYYHDREPGKTDAYASSVTGKARLHEFYDTFLRNEWLREDVASGRMGIGLTANIAPALVDIRKKLKNPLWRWF